MRVGGGSTRRAEIETEGGHPRRRGRTPLSNQGRDRVVGTTTPASRSRGSRQDQRGPTGRLRHTLHNRQDGRFSRKHPLKRENLEILAKVGLPCVNNSGEKSSKPPQNKSFPECIKLIILKISSPRARARAFYNSPVRTLKSAPYGALRLLESGDMGSLHSTSPPGRPGRPRAALEELLEAAILAVPAARRKFGGARVRFLARERPRKSLCSRDLSRMSHKKYYVNLGVWHGSASPCSVETCAALEAHHSVRSGEGGGIARRAQLAGAPTASRRGGIFAGRPRSGASFVFSGLRVSGRDLAKSRWEVSDGVEERADPGGGLEPAGFREGDPAVEGGARGDCSGLG